MVIFAFVEARSGMPQTRGCSRGSADFGPVFRQLLGETAPLSPNTMIRIKEEWQAEYEAWRCRPLENESSMSGQTESTSARDLKRRTAACSRSWARERTEARI